jgi:hypothetical protein
LSSAKGGLQAGLSAVFGSFNMSLNPPSGTLAVSEVESGWRQSVQPVRFGQADACRVEVAGSRLAVAEFSAATPGMIIELAISRQNRH